MLHSEEKISETKYAAGTEIFRSSKKFLLDMAKDCKKGKVLDIGCGTGVNAVHLDSMGFEVTGIDLSKTAIEKFTERGFSGLVHDITSNIPFEDNSFEMVFASEVIEHLDDVNAFLSEIQRVLKPEGCLILSTPNSVFWAYRLLTMLGKSPSEFQHPGHLRFFSPRLLNRSLQGTGFFRIQMSGRNMYFIIGEVFASFLSPILEFLPIFQKETRFLTQKSFFHISRKSKIVSPFWSDTILVKAFKM